MTSALILEMVVTKLMSRLLLLSGTDEFSELRLLECLLLMHVKAWAGSYARTRKYTGKIN